MQFIHPATRTTIETYGTSMPQGLIVSGLEGVGLSGIASSISTLLKAVTITVQPIKDEKIDLEKGVITVDSIRRLYDQTKTITKTARVIVIDYAERMGHGSQNAFLKLLEEPPEHTYFILLTHDPKSLLPTIHSRTQHIEARPITASQSEELLDQLKVLDPTKRTQLLFIAGGFPAELHHLAKDEVAFTKRAQMVRDARMLVQGKRYDAIVLAQKYKDDRQASLTILKDAMKMLRRSASQQTDAAQVLAKIDTLLTVYERIKANGNIRIQLAASAV